MVHGIPVIPLFVAEMTGNDQFAAFDFSKANSTLPDVPRVRKPNANQIVSKLRYTYVKNRR